MKKIIPLIFLSLVSFQTLEAQQKRAQTSMKFLSVSTSARASAMSDAVTSVNMGAYSPFYNPATMALIENNVSLTAGVVQWIADIDHNSASLIFKPGNGKIGVFGLNATSVDYGNIIATVRDNDPNNPLGYLDNGFVDTFREQHPDEVAYSWWSYRFQARARNIGWRLDYFLVSQSIIENVKKSFILPVYEGSDHCPVGIELDL